MEELNKQITDLESMLASKGYDGNFLSDHRFPGKLSDSLRSFMEQKQNSGSEPIDSIKLTTFSDWQTGKRLHTTCDFMVQYQPEKGFQVKELVIDKTQWNNISLASKSIPVRTRDDIPAKGKANELVASKPSNTPKRKRFKR